MRQEQGSALLIALIVVLIVVSVSAAFLVDTLARSRAASGGRESDEAQLLCEAALEKTRRALFIYRTQETYSWDEILSDHAALPLEREAHWRDYVEAREGPVFADHVVHQDEAGFSTFDDAPPPDDPNHFLGRSMPFGGGAYFVVIRDNDDQDGDDLIDSDDHLLVYVTASLPDGTQRQIEALVYWRSSRFTPADGILIDGNARFNGTVDLLGERGTVHANGDLVLEGQPTFSVSANATGQIEEGTAPTPPEGFNEGVEAIDIPHIIPQNFRDRATYLLGADGRIRDGLTGEVVTPARMGWTWSGGQWSLEGKLPAPPGLYYVEGNARISGSSSQTISVVATGSIEVTGGGSFQPFERDTLFLAGGDISLGGNTATYTGLIAAEEQVRCHGTFSHEGVLLAKNARNAHGLVHKVEFSGTVSITYDGGMVTSIENPLNTVPIRAMRRLK